MKKFLYFCGVKYDNKYSDGATKIIIDFIDIRTKEKKSQSFWNHQFELADFIDQAQTQAYILWDVLPDEVHHISTPVERVTEFYDFLDSNIGERKKIVEVFEMFNPENVALESLKSPKPESGRAKRFFKGRKKWVQEGKSM